MARVNRRNAQAIAAPVVQGVGVLMRPCIPRTLSRELLAAG